MKINSTELRSFFYGTLLGDSYIHNGIFYCKQISHDLIEFKRKIIENNLPDARCRVSEHKAYTDKNGVHHQKFWILAARGEYIKKLEKLFYPEGKKIVPKGVVSKLTPLGLAMWYADDGTTILVGKTDKGSAKSRRVQLCTDGFTKQEVEQIVEELTQKDRAAAVLHRTKEMYRVQFLREDRQHFLLSIAAYFYKYFPSLLYKMDLGYRGESLSNRRYVLEEYQDLYIKISTHPDFVDRMKNR